MHKAPRTARRVANTSEAFLAIKAVSGRYRPGVRLGPQFTRRILSELEKFERRRFLSRSFYTL